MSKSIWPIFYCTSQVLMLIQTGQGYAYLTLPNRVLENNIRRTMGETYARFEILVNVDIKFHD